MDSKEIRGAASADGKIKDVLLINILGKLPTNPVREALGLSALADPGGEKEKKE